jgi:transposase-like protein
MAFPRIYTDENAAREHLEGLLWPDGPVCPHCGTVDQATRLQGKTTRPGLLKCRSCEKPFSVTVGTVFERSKIKLHQWVYASHLLTSSKKGISSHQLSRLLKVSYKTAWFMAHRIREAMRPAALTPMGGPDSIIESDETFIGKSELAPKGRNAKRRHWSRNIVLTLVEHGASARSFKVDSAGQDVIWPIIAKNIRRESDLMTDEGSWYKAIGREFATHRHYCKRRPR